MTYGERLQQQGIQQGVQQGIQQGMQQGIEAVAKSMLSDRTPVEQVSKWTGLSKEKVAKLSRW